LASIFEGLPRRPLLVLEGLKGLTSALKTLERDEILDLIDSLEFYLEAPFPTKSLEPDAISFALSSLSFHLFESIDEA
jgi:hypothetical protein